MLSREVVSLVSATCMLDPSENGSARLLGMVDASGPPEPVEAAAHSLKTAAQDVQMRAVQVWHEKAAVCASVPVASCKRPCHRRAASCQQWALESHVTASYLLLQVMRMHVLDNVRQRIEAGLRDFVSEIRVCTVVFLGFPSLQVPRYPVVLALVPADSFIAVRQSTLWTVCCVEPAAATCPGDIATLHSCAKQRACRHNGAACTGHVPALAQKLIAPCGA